MPTPNPPQPQENEATSIDLNEIATSLVTRTISGIATAAFDGAKSALEEVRIRLGTAFTRYLDQQLARRSRVKTILYREDPKFIYSFYVPQDLQSGTTKLIKSVDTDSLLKITRRAILCGTGGMGKSILLRHLFVDFVRKSSMVPIFIDLRMINENGNTFDSVLAGELASYGLDLSPEALVRCMKRGVFALLLDGLDEVVAAKRDATSKQIQEFGRNCPDVPLVVTSRPDERFVGWDDFIQFQVLPFTLDKVRSLVTRLEYDEGDKVRFLADVETNLWKSHQSFLSNPLLLTIMLMTYSHHASVPSKMHLFYSQVFETLWNRHDATKDGYKRTLVSGLQKDVFLRVLEAFAVKTYLENLVSLSDSQVHDALTWSRNLNSCPGDNSTLLDDMVRSLCILNHDGLQYTYTHRSFQEYYTARFLRHAEPEQRKRAYDRLLKTGPSEAVLGLLWDMDRGMVERELVVPRLEMLESSVRGKQGEERQLAFLKLWCVGLTLIPRGDGGYNCHQFSTGTMPHLLDFVQKHYFSERWKKLVQHESAKPVQVTEVGNLQQFASKESPGLLEIPASECGSVPGLLASLGQHKCVFANGAVDMFVETLDGIRSELRRQHDSVDDLFRVNQQ